MITSKLTAKAQTTIPQAVRHHLGLKEGDMLGYIIEGERVLLSKPAESAPEIFMEWDTQADQRAFYGL